MLCLVLLTALVQPPTAPTAPGGARPEQAVAIIDGEGKLRITQVSFPCGYGNGPGAAETESAVLIKRGAEKVPIKVKINSLVLTTTELPASAVDAYTVDGKPIPADKLPAMLAKERTVLMSKDGRKVDPFFLDLYKEGTIILVPPADALQSAVGPYGAAIPGPGLEPLPPPPAPPEKPRDREP